MLASYLRMELMCTPGQPHGGRGVQKNMVLAQNTAKGRLGKRLLAALVDSPLVLKTPVSYACSWA